MTGAPDLDRMAIADVGFTPELIALEIYRQLGDIAPPIPVEAISLSLDIDEIQRRVLDHYEGALATDPERSCGVIQVNARSILGRQRYSIAHELGHFLCGWHQQIVPGRFACSQRDMIVTAGEGLHAKQEAEANSFAIELLAPKRFFARYQKRLPDLDHVLELSDLLQVSKTAAARLRHAPPRSPQCLPRTDCSSARTAAQASRGCRYEKGLGFPLCLRRAPRGRRRR